LKRKSAVGGYFYPGREDALRTMVEGMLDSEMKKEKAVCVVSPHAGFEYSGPVAGAVFSSVQLPGTFVILGPSHRPIQSRIAIMKQGTWETPLGDVKIDTSLAELMMAHSSFIEEDELAHVSEHSLEVQLPFIQCLREDAAIVPLCLSYHISFEELEELGQAIAKGIQEYKQDVLVVASTDMSHYVDQSVAKQKDFLAIERILELDARGLHDIVERENISMCGFQPTTSAIVASKELGGEKASLVLYQTSGDRTGNFSEVVGYAGIRIT
jgi:AmmeMemoRadiSam system protein B